MSATTNSTLPIPRSAFLLIILSACTARQPSRPADLPEQGITLVWAINAGESPPDLAPGLMRATWEYLSRVILEQ